MGRFISEQIKKVQARASKALASLTESRKSAKAQRADKRKAHTAVAEKYHKEYLDAERKTIEAKRTAKAKGAFFVEGEAKIALVIRIKGVNKLPPK